MCLLFVAIFESICIGWVYGKTWLETCYVISITVSSPVGSPFICREKTNQWQLRPLLETRRTQRRLLSGPRSVITNHSCHSFFKPKEETRVANVSVFQAATDSTETLKTWLATSPSSSLNGAGWFWPRASVLWVHRTRTHTPTHPHRRYNWDEQAHVEWQAVKARALLYLFIYIYVFIYLCFYFYWNGQNMRLKDRVCHVLPLFPWLQFSWIIIIIINVFHLFYIYGSEVFFIQLMTLIMT